MLQVLQVPQVRTIWFRWWKKLLQKLKR